MLAPVHMILFVEVDSRYTSVPPEADAGFAFVNDGSIRSRVLSSLGQEIDDGGEYSSLNVVPRDRFYDAVTHKIPPLT